MDQKKEFENENIAQEENTEQEEMTASGQEQEQEVADEAKTANSAVSQLEKEVNEQKDKYIRLYSEFENFRRRTAKEKLDMIKTANESMVSALLPVLDDFERALKNIGQEENKKEEQEGIMLIYNKLFKVLEQKGVTAMDLKQGDDFDAEFQEAITQIPAPDESLKGKIVDVVEKGYTLGEKVIRFAKVVIGA